MIERLKRLADRYRELGRMMAGPEVATDPAKMGALAREYGRLRRPHDLHAELAELDRGIAEAREILQGGSEDPEFRLLAEQDLARLGAERDRLLLQVEDLFLDQESGADRGAVIEIRPGTGGEEAALFAADLLRMYSRFVERRGWKLEVLEHSATDLGGVKNAVIAIEGSQVFKDLRHEGGTHRVQRIPRTEAGGRIHTSAATVAVIPEADDQELEIRKEDLDVTASRAGGPGGQHVNKTESAIQIVHKPTGITVKARTERSQIRNRELAMKLLRARILEHAEARKKSELADLRRSQIGSGDRSEKIRTYNFPQNRVTDHRINFTTHDLAGILDGDLGEMIAKLNEAEREKRLARLRRPRGSGP